MGVERQGEDKPACSVLEDMRSQTSGDESLVPVDESSGRSSIHIQFLTYTLEPYTHPAIETKLSDPPPPPDNSASSSVYNLQTPLRFPSRSI